MNQSKLQSAALVCCRAEPTTFAWVGPPISTVAKNLHHIDVDCGQLIT